jgi:signal transduction histidine kinase
VRQLDQAAQSVDREFVRLTSLTAILLWCTPVLIGALVLMVLWIIGGSFVRPFRETASALEALSHGDYAVKVAGATRKNEVGNLARAFAVFKKAMMERDATEAALLRSHEDLGRFTYAATHDLKAPLSGIQNVVEWLRDDPHEKLSPQQAEFLGLVDQRVARMHALLSGILAYWKADGASKQSVEVDTAGLIGGLVHKEGWPDSIEIVPDVDLPRFFTPPGPFEQVLRQLIDNAVRHHDRDSGAVHISVEDAGDFYHFHVVDDGPGIAPEYRDKVFQMFETLDGNLDNAGIGLALVKRLVERHGGWVDVGPAPSGRGSDFVFAWPKRIDRTTAQVMHQTALMDQVQRNTDRLLPRQDTADISHAESAPGNERKIA